MMNHAAGNSIRSGENLWSLAADKLDKADRQYLNFDHQDKLEVLSDLQTLTLRSRDECINKRWRFSRKGGKGETIILRDLFSKIVVWVERFIKIGDNAIQYDPGHAALPWAGVRFLLQIAVDDIEKFDFVVEGAEMIAHMIDRYAIHENLYLVNSTVIVDKLRDALVGLYAAIMNYLARAKRYFEQKTYVRILKTIISVDDFDPLFKNMTLAQIKVDQYAVLVHAENCNSALETLRIDSNEKQLALTQLLNNLNEPISRISNYLIAIEDHLDRGKRAEILRWISPQPYIEYHNQNKKDVLTGTGSWLLSESCFKNWKKDSASSLLWLHGMPGSGKSKLVSIVIEDAMEKYKNAQGTRPVYFYCSRNTSEPERSNPRAILASIVRQLSSLEPGLPILQPILRKYQEEEDQAFPSGGLQIDTSCELIIELASLHAETVIVLDALDECDPENRYQLLEAMETILNQSNGLVKIFASSRDDDDIVYELRNYPNLKISSNKNSKDIGYFIKTETERLVSKNRLLRNSHSKDELKKLIIDKVIRGADGMFRWASMQLEALCLLKLDDEIRARLGKLPKKLTSLYHDIYNGLFNNPYDIGRPLITNIFIWLLCAQEKFTTSEFLVAISTGLEKPAGHLKNEDVLRLACNFVDYDEGLDVFRFAHLSVREFLEELPEYSTTSSNALAAEICLLTLIGNSKSPAASNFLRSMCKIEGSYEQLLVAGSDDRKLAQSRFHSYATSFWHCHCRMAGGKRACSPLKDTLHFFLFDESDRESALNTWVSSYTKTGDEFGGFYLADLLYSYPGSIARAFLLACRYSFCEVIEICVLKRCLSIDLKQEGLELAVKTRQSLAVVELLRIEENIKVTHNVMTEMLYFTDSEVDHLEELLPTLLDRGGDLYITEEVLLHAVFESSRVMQLLLERGDPRQITEAVLLRVAENGDKEMMNLMLNFKKDAEITDNLMIAAISNTRDEGNVFLFLLEHGGKINEAVIDAIARSDKKNEIFINLLHDKINLISPTKETLKTAAAQGTAEAVRVLLSRGGILTPELVIAGATNEDNGGEVIRELLDWDEFVEITEEAMVNGVSNWESGQEILEAFLAYDSSIEITEDILKAAAPNPGPHSEVTMRLLLDRPNRAKISEEILIASTCTAFTRGGRAGNVVLGTLLEPTREKEVTVTETLVRRALARLECDEVIVQLLDRSRGIPITPPLLAAAASNHCGNEMVQLLLDRSPHINITEDVVKAAAGNFAISTKVMMMLLRDRSSTVEITEEVLKAAASSGNTHVLEMLLDQQHDQHQDEDKMTHTIHVPEMVIIAAAGNWNGNENIRMLWDRTKGFQITEAIINAVLMTYYPNDVLVFLLNRASTTEKEMAITEAVVTKAAGCDRKTIEALLPYSNVTATTEPMLKAATASWDVGTLQFFLDRSDQLKVTEEVIEAAATSGNEDGVALLLCHYLLAPSRPWLDIAKLFKWRGDKALVQTLISQGVDIDVSDSHGRTPLSVAAERGNKVLVQVLLEAKAQPESRDSKGMTPVHWAAKEDHRFIVQVLLEKCVPPLAKDNDGNSPSDIAYQNDHFRLAKLLKNFDEKKGDFRDWPPKA